MSLQAHLPEEAGTPFSANARITRWFMVLTLLISVAVLDAATGHELSVFLLYTIPVALCTHQLGARAGVVISLLAAVAWVCADQASGHTYTQDWILPVNALNRLFCFLLAVLAIRYLEERRAAVAQRLRAFTGTVPHCTQCDRLCGEDGHWRAPPAYLSEFGGAELPAKVCPDCARRSYARAAYRCQPEPEPEVGPASDEAPQVHA